VWLSELDEQRFGVRTARAILPTLEVLSDILDFCERHRVVFLISRCSVADIRLAQALERHKFELMDTLVYYQCDLLKNTPIRPPKFGTNQPVIRSMYNGEESTVEKIALESFRGYIGHYHADERLSQVKCDETYQSWARNLAQARSATNELLVAEVNGKLAGFVALRTNNALESEIVLNAVSPAMQRQGVYRALLVAAVEWARGREFERLLISSQLNNLAVQKVWTEVGFKLEQAYYTFHKWFDPS
jgi:GNAT superfamily N-acetyltransferase